MRFFFKQKTAYEMRSSDWSSDVCSSDLLLLELAREGAAVEAEAAGGLGDVEITFDQHLVDAFPFERLDRGGPRDERRAGIALTLVKRVLDIVGVRRLDQLMRGAELDRLDRGGDARKIGRAHV